MECQVSLSTNQPPSSKMSGCQHGLFASLEPFWSLQIARLRLCQRSVSWWNNEHLASPLLTLPPTTPGTPSLAPTSTRTRGSPYPTPHADSQVDSTAGIRRREAQGETKECQGMSSSPPRSYHTHRRFHDSTTLSRHPGLPSHTFLAGLAPFIHHHPCMITILLRSATLASLAPSFRRWQHSLAVPHWPKRPRDCYQLKLKLKNSSLSQEPRLTTRVFGFSMRTRHTPDTSRARSPGVWRSRKGTSAKHASWCLSSFPKAFDIHSYNLSTKSRG
ncbi:hypothetical protein LZ30DRAFT_3559 [Colletotrichum cereale]|nr:hypothetical protein LZ30DRAFT_3559 [Colletotrichum cereale]